MAIRQGISGAFLEASVLLKAAAEQNHTALTSQGRILRITSRVTTLHSESNHMVKRQHQGVFMGSIIMRKANLAESALMPDTGPGSHGILLAAMEKSNQRLLSPFGAALFVKLIGAPLAPTSCGMY